VTDLASISTKLANFIRLLASDKDGEVVASARAIVRTLANIGADIHDIANRIEHSSNGALSEKEMQEIYNAGIAAGLKLAEQKLRNRTYQSTLQMPPASDMAMFCYQHRDQLNEPNEKFDEREFILNMVSLTRRCVPLSERRQRCLEGIYLRLAGRI
jgi:hypothetical protein